MNDVSQADDLHEPVIEWGNLTLPQLCPGCGSPVVREQRLHPTRSGAPQLLALYACDAVITNTPSETGQPQVNVAVGCRLLLLKTILSQRG